MLNRIRICVLEKTFGLIVCCLLVFGIATPPGIAAAQESPKLQIVVLAGEGATNNIKLRLSRELIVKVEDENNKPVAGATVLFMLPDSGAGGAFKDAGKMLSVKTNEEGIAVARQFVPNDIVGDFKIQVEASNQGQVGSALISQSNVIVGGAAAAGGISGALLAVIIGGAVAGAVIAVKAATGGDKETASQPSTPSGTINIGGDPSMGAP